MFKPMVIRRIKQGVKTRKLEINENSTDRTIPDDIGGAKFLYVKINKRTMKLIKTSMQVQADRTSDPRFFDPVSDKDEIAAILEAADDIRRAYDIVSEGA